MKKKNIPISSMLRNNKAYELVGNADLQQLLEYDLSTSKIQLLQEVTFDEITYTIPENDLVANNTILLATYPLEYRDTITLYKSIRSIIWKYVDIPEQYLTIASLYVMMTWIFDQFQTLPYLRVIGDFGTGKSRFLEVVGSMCYRPCFAGGASSVSPIFRIIEIYGGVTLVFDEADFSFSGPESEMVKILNCGYSQGMPVLRTEGDGNSRIPKSYKVFGPKILGTRKRYQDLALESRCLTNVMTGIKRNNIPLHLPSSFKEEALEIRNKLLKFRLDHLGKIDLKDSKGIAGVDPRINQIALPIFSLLEDKAVQQEVTDFITSLKDTIRESRSEEEPALILKALVYLIINETQSLKYSLISETIDKLAEHSSSFRLVPPTIIGKVNRSVLNLEKRLVNGTAEIKNSSQNIERIIELSERYGLLVDDVDLVDKLKMIINSSAQEADLEYIKEVMF